MSKPVRVNVELPAAVHTALRIQAVSHGLGLNALVPAALAVVVNDPELLARATAAAQEAQAAASPRTRTP